MKLLYSDGPIYGVLNPYEESIFLAGPTPRSKEVESWRPEAIKIFESLQYNGQLIIPENSDKNNDWEIDGKDYISQCQWEDYGLENSTKIIFWIPRNLDDMPAFTTNVEFGRYSKHLKTFYGRPNNSPNNRYLDWLYKKDQTKTIHSNLTELIHYTLNTNIK